MKKRILTLALALVMCLSLVPSALADIQPYIQYIYGADRVATANAIAREGWPTAQSVILCSGEDAHLIDSIAVSTLAGQENAPILLVLGKTIDARVIAEIQRLGASKAYIVGYLGADVAAELASAIPAIQTEILQGADRLATALLINHKMNHPRGVFLVGYDALTDAVSAASWASAQGWLIQLAGGDGVYDAAYWPSLTAGLNDKIIVGGPSLVSDAPGFIRAYGADRYATNKALRQIVPYAYTNVYMANGETVVDALTGSALAGKSQAAIVLTPANDPNRADFSGVLPRADYYAFGGPAASAISEQDADLTDLQALNAKLYAIGQIYFELDVNSQSDAQYYKCWVKGHRMRSVITSAGDATQTLVAIYDQDAGITLTYFEGTDYAAKNAVNSVVSGNSADLTDLKISGFETLAGVRCVVLGDPNGSGHTLWVSDDGLTRKMEVTNDDEVISFVYKNYQRDLEISDDLFQLPAGMTIVE